MTSTWSVWICASEKGRTRGRNLLDFFERRVVPKRFLFIPLSSRKMLSLANAFEICSSVNRLPSIAVE